jgi:hypothetical protein
MMKNQACIKGLLGKLPPEPDGIEHIARPQQLVWPVKALFLKKDDLVMYWYIT